MELFLTLLILTISTSLELNSKNNNILQFNKNNKEEDTSIKMKTVSSNKNESNKEENAEYQYMKPAKIIKPDDYEEDKEKKINHRVNYMSSVITRKPTSTITRKNALGDQELTFDLDKISK